MADTSSARRGTGTPVSHRQMDAELSDDSPEADAQTSAGVATQRTAVTPTRQMIPRPKSPLCENESPVGINRFAGSPSPVGHTPDARQQRARFEARDGFVNQDTNPFDMSPVLLWQLPGWSTDFGKSPDKATTAVSSASPYRAKTP